MFISASAQLADKDTVQDEWAYDPVFDRIFGEARGKQA